MTIELRTVKGGASRKPRLLCRMLADKGRPGAELK
jgi:hypothetical protein